MHFDEYGGGIGSFVWYWYERLGGFSKAKLPNPLATGMEGVGDQSDLSQAAWMHDWGGTAVTGQVSRGIPARLGEMYEAARRLTDKPLKVSVGAGPPNLTYHVDFKVPGLDVPARRASSPRTSSRSSTRTSRTWRRAAPTSSRSRTSAPGCSRSTTSSDWVIDVLNAWIDGVDAKIAWHCCLGAGYGNTFRAVEDALPRVLERWMAVDVEQYALDFALRDMADVKALKWCRRTRRCRSASSTSAPSTSSPMTRSSSGSTGARAHRTRAGVPSSTDCGLKALPRFCAYEKLRALSRAAARVRSELGAPVAA